MFGFVTLVTSEKAKYIDKTALLHEMCSDEDKQLFISRQRRFEVEYSYDGVKVGPG